MGLSLFILLVTNTINTLLLFLVLRSRSTEVGRRLVSLFAGSIIFLIAWSTANFFADTSGSSSEALFWTRATFLPALASCWCIFYFSTIFHEKKNRNYMLLGLYSIGALVFSVLSMTPFVIQEVSVISGVGVSAVVFGSWYVYSVIFYFSLIAHATYNLIVKYRRLSGLPKSQVGYVLLGWGSFLFFALLTNAVLPLLTGTAEWSKFGPLGSVIMVGSITYTIVRHEFFDIKVIIQRGIVYSILVSLIGLVYVSLLFVTQYFFNIEKEVDVMISAFITALLGIFGVPPLTVFFQKVTAKIFFKDAYDYVTVLASLAAVLNESIDRESIVAKTTTILTTALKSDKITFEMETDPKVVASGAYAVSVPIIGNTDQIGVLHLGAKRSGDRYTSQDMSLLTTFCSQAAVALEKAGLYTQVLDYASTLEKKVAERTADIARLQKEQESMMLEISHGLQTPLTIMKGELFFLRKQGYETSKIDTIDSSINRISGFIYKLLSLYRLETKTYTELETVSLSALLHELAGTFQDEARSQGGTISVDVLHDVFVEGNREGLEEVLSNLLTNAIKYSKADEPNTIVMHTEEDDSEVRIVVSDTGIGIAEEHMPSLFKQFYRVKDETTKKIQGTGLGLAICKRIVEMHGGTISLSSALGTGSVFTITLPKVRV